MAVQTASPRGRGHLPQARRSDGELSRSQAQVAAAEAFVHLNADRSALGLLFSALVGHNLAARR
jgi:hypothetical protein